MDRARSTYEGKTGEYMVLVGKLVRRRPLERPRRRCKNIKMDLQEVEWGMDWIDLAQGRNRWRALVNAVMNRPVT